MATFGIVGSYVAGDFFLGVDILVTSMLVNFVLIAMSVLTLPERNPALARAVTVLPSRTVQVPLAIFAIAVLSVFLAVHTWRDLTVPTRAWYFRSTPLWAIVMTFGSFLYWREASALRRAGVDLGSRFATLPPG